MADRTTNEKLFKLTDNMPGWHHYFNYNVEVMSETVFKIVNLQNVEFESLQHGSILKWDAKALAWKVAYSRET